MATQLTIATHDGSFHCDEALACFLLFQTQKFRDAKVIRTRKEEAIRSADIVVDVGGVYDAEKYRLDHHQASFTQTFSPRHDIKLSSAGLTYLHFGREVIQSLTHIHDPLQVEALYLKIYDDFILPIDAIDNGVNAAEDLRYRVRTDLSSRIGRLNPSWSDPAPDYDARFHQAIKVAGEDFSSYLAHIVDDWMPARECVRKAVEEREERERKREREERVGEGDREWRERVLRLESYAPWVEHLFDIEKEKGKEGKFLFVLYPDTSGKHRIHAVPMSPGSFTSRLPLPSEWRGLRDDVLSKVSGIEGCVFVHATGFIGGNDTLEGVMKMAEEAVRREGK